MRSGTVLYFALALGLVGCLPPDDTSSDQQSSTSTMTPDDCRTRVSSACEDLDIDVMRCEVLIDTACTDPTCTPPPPPPPPPPDPMACYAGVFEMCSSTGASAEECDRQAREACFPEVISDPMVR